MVIYLVLALGIVSLGLLVVAFTLRAPALAALNLMICFSAGVLLQPWTLFTAKPTFETEDDFFRPACIIWVLAFSISILGFLVLYLMTASKKREGGRRRKRRRRRRSDRSRDDAQDSDSES